MRLLLLNINYLQYQNIIKTMQKNIRDSVNSKSLYFQHNFRL